MNQTLTQLPETRRKLVETIVVGLQKTGGIQFGCYTLTDGSLSPYYVNLRPLLSTRTMIEGETIGEHIVDAYYRMIKEEIGFDNIELILSIPKASQLYAGALWERTKVPVGYVEAGVKPHGMRLSVEAFLHDRDRILLLDDLITSAKSKKEAIQSVIDQAENDKINVTVNDLVVLLNRLQGGPEELLRYITPVTPNGVRTRYLFNTLDMLDILYQKQLITADQYNVSVEFTKTKKLDEEYIKKYTTPRK